MTKEEFQSLAASRVLFLDGATGSNLMKAGMPRGVCTEAWILDHKEVLKNLQRSYAKSGSDILYAPTFGANRIALEGHGLAKELESMNRALVAISREVADEAGHILVAGDVTTAGRPIGSEPAFSYENLFSVYQEQISILADSKVDLLVAETLLSVEEAMLIVDAAASVCDLPIMCSITVSSDGAAYFGGTAMELVASVQEMGAVAAGINCSTGPDQLEAIVKSMKEVASIPLIVKPNAGMPVIDEKGNAIYSMQPDAFAKHMRVLEQAGAGILGGCCGTTPDFIRALYQEFHS